MKIDWSVFNWISKEIIENERQNPKDPDTVQQGGFTTVCVELFLSFLESNFAGESDSEDREDSQGAEFGRAIRGHRAALQAAHSHSREEE